MVCMKDFCAVDCSSVQQSPKLGMSLQFSMVLAGVTINLADAASPYERKELIKVSLHGLTSVIIKINLLT